MFSSHSRAVPLFSEPEESACNFCHLRPLIDPHFQLASTPHFNTVFPDLPQALPPDKIQK